MTRPEQAPVCARCETELECPDCKELRRPTTAHDIYAPGHLLTPFDRWETVERVERTSGGFYVHVWTKECGPNFFWSYYQHDRVKFVPARTDGPAVPEIRVVEQDGRDGYMYVLAIPQGRSYGLVPPAPSVLAESRSGGRGKGWWVQTRPAGEAAEDGTISRHVPEVVDSKAQARSKLHKVARAYAKTLGVKVTFQTR